MYLSIYQAVDIWDDLINAMDGKHHYGSNTAEIYAYRLMPNMPRMLISVEEITIAEKIRAARSLVELLNIFSEKHNVYFLINELEANSWLNIHGHTFDHRVQIKCIKNKR